MNFSSIIMILAVLGVGLGLLMKFSPAIRNALRVDDPSVDKNYMEYKINFIIAIGAGLMIIQGLGLIIPSFSRTMDMLMSVFLVLAIITDTVIKQKMRRKNRK